MVDERLASFVVNSHMRSHPDTNIHHNGNNFELENDRGGNDGIQQIDQKLLKQYLVYARTNTRPVMHAVDSEKVVKLFF